MTLQEFLKGRKKYNDFVLIEENGDKEKIKEVSKQHGKKTNGYVLLYNRETEHLSKHQIYVSNRGYSILWRRRKILLNNFKWFFLREETH